MIQYDLGEGMKVPIPVEVKVGQLRLVFIKCKCISVKNLVDKAT